MTLPKKVEEEGKHLELKRTVNALIDYLTDRESKKVEEPDVVNTYRMTVQTAQVPVEIIPEVDVPVGTMEEISDKMVRVKRERGWEVLSSENWLKESEGR